MSSSQVPASVPTVQTLLQSFLLIAGLPFADILTPDDCAGLFTKHGPATATASNAGTPAHADNSTTPSSSPATTAASGPDSGTTVGPPAAPPPTPTTRATAAPCPIWTHVLTLWTFLHQVVSASQSCSAAVLRAVVLLTGLRCSPCSENPGAYSKARGRLPLGLLQELTLLVGVRLDAACPDSWRWLGHRVLLADGWVVTLPDTPENQQAYPQPKTQKKGLGFPQVRLVGLFSRAGNVVVGVKWGPCHGKRTGETALLRDIFDQLRPGDVLVADRYYCSYFMIALLKQRGVEVVFHLHQRRQHTFGNGRSLGEEDEIVAWEKPTQCPEWLAQDIYEALPDTLEVRLLGVTVSQRGFRTQHVRIVTTLLDAQRYSKAAVSSVYRDRWDVEGMIRTLKTYMHMEMLRCQTPAMVHKEIWTYLLAYNLIRKTMAQAAQSHGYQPWEISFSQTLQALDAYRYALALATPEEAVVLGKQLLLGLTRLRVGHRPDRVEPRQVKRRPKPYGRLMKPRGQARQDILDRPGGEPRRKKQRRQQPAAQGAGTSGAGSVVTTAGSGPAPAAGQ
jgi:Transposase DDE domain